MKGLYSGVLGWGLSGPWEFVDYAGNRIPSLQHRDSSSSRLCSYSLPSESRLSSLPSLLRLKPSYDFAVSVFAVADFALVSVTAALFFSAFYIVVASQWLGGGAARAAGRFPRAF